MFSDAMSATGEAQPQLLDIALNSPTARLPQTIPPGTKP